MSTFEFVAFSPSGKKQTGTVKARSLGEAKRKIQKKRYDRSIIKPFFFLTYLSYNKIGTIF